jgi:hypothetical protein
MPQQYSDYRKDYPVAISQSKLDANRHNTAQSTLQPPSTGVNGAANVSERAKSAAPDRAPDAA